LENVAAGQSHSPLDIWGTENFSVDYGIWDVGAESAESVEGKQFSLLTVVVPGSRRETIGHVLGEHAHGVGSFRRDGRIMDALKIEFRP
jgi:hypothetical protein